MSAKVSPCMGCGERKLGCHDACIHYKAWKWEVDKARVARKEETAANDVAIKGRIRMAAQKNLSKTRRIR